VSGCQASCPEGYGLQTFTYTSTSSQQVNNTNCPSKGDSYNATCNVECPRNCSGNDQRISCDAPCGPATCQLRFFTYSPADVGGSCDSYNATKEAPVQLENCCSGVPARWQSFLVSSWKCPANANGLTTPNRKCEGTCMQGTSPDPTQKPEAACDNGTFTQFSGSCVATGRPSPSRDVSSVWHASGYAVFETLQSIGQPCVVHIHLAVLVQQCIHGSCCGQMISELPPHTDVFS
jgi:hypothetical protein